MSDQSSTSDYVTWAASSRSSPEEAMNLHRWLPVGLIVTPRSSFRTCRLDETLADVVANTVQAFDHLPVVDGVEDAPKTIVGVLDLRSIKSKTNLQGTVKECMDRLSEQCLIGADASILDFVRKADRQSCRLVVSGSEINGLVTLSDLQRLPVRAVLFALITHSEITMANAIRRECEEPDTWMDRLSDNRQEKIRSEVERSTDEDGFVDSLLFTQFGDKVTILRKSPRFPFERKTKFKDDMRNVEKLRDKIAHANDFASTPAAAEGVCRTVRSLDCWVRRLDSWPAVADPPEIPRKQV